MAEEDPPTKALTKNPLGPCGKAVAENVERLRTEQNLTFAALSDRLSRIGRPIPPLGLRKIVAETRRVDADDLVALAVVLSTTPASLLMPGLATANPDDQIKLVDGSPTSSAVRAWEWLTARNRIARIRFPLFVARSWPTWEQDKYEADHYMLQKQAREELQSGVLWPHPSGLSSGAPTRRGSDGDD